MGFWLLGYSISVLFDSVCVEIRKHLVSRVFETSIIPNEIVSQYIFYALIGKLIDNARRATHSSGSYCDPWTHEVMEK